MGEEVTDAGENHVNTSGLIYNQVKGEIGAICNKNVGEEKDKILVVRQLGSVTQVGG
jgi:DNA-binding transcriptional regulator YhcF (GntR family)